MDDDGSNFPMQTPPTSSMSDDDFEAMKARFIAVGDKLTDLQLLDLADCYHEMLRQRRAIRARHPSLAPASSSGIEAERRTF